jgi:hypothetical protein
MMGDSQREISELEGTSVQTEQEGLLFPGKQKQESVAFRCSGVGEISAGK